MDQLMVRSRTRDHIADDGSRAPTRAEVIGRGAELEAIDRFLADGTARALVLEGEAGIGKSTVLSEGVERARERGLRVLHAKPAAVELPLSFAGLHDLLEGVPRQAREGLPGSQQQALAVALAEEEAGSSAIEPGVLGVAVLALLGELARERPVLLAIDDLQWLDEESGAVIVYALRRLGGARIQLLASCRGEPGAPLPFALERALVENSLVRIALGPLSEGAIRRIVRLQLGVSLSRVQLHAIYAASGGNPFYSLELVRSGLDEDESGSIHLPRSLHELAGARVERLPAETRDALVFVAALVDPTREVLARAGLRDGLQPALDGGVVEMDGDRIRFTHPLIGAAAWFAATEERRREIHRTLADAVESREQRARHLAAAAESPNREIATVLEQAAATAHLRGAAAAAADFLDRALELTPADDTVMWARLAANAAVAHAEASHWDSVWALVEQAQARLPAGPERAAILLMATEMRPGLNGLLQQAVAEAGETPVGVQARVGLSQQAGLSGRLRDANESAQEATRIARLLGDRGLLGVALAQLGAVKLLDSQLDGWEELNEALAIEDDLGSLPANVFQSPRTWQAVWMTFGDNPRRARLLFEKRLAIDLERGDDMSACQSTPILVLAELFAGDWAEARRVARVTLDRVEVLGYEYARPIMLGTLATVEAYEGNLERARDLGTEALSTLVAFGDRFMSTFTLASLVFTELCAGNASAALTRAGEISERFPTGRECWWSYHQGDEIEALVLCGEHERALARVEALRTAGAQLPLPRFLAWAERGAALVHAARGDLEAAQAALEAALSYHALFPNPFERARTLFVYGHVLRRQQRRREARAALSEALAAFERLGARHFVGAVQQEQKHVGGRPPAGEHELTGAEDRIARLVADGLSNKEVAAELFLAVSTVEAALTRVYRKLGLTSRTQLAHALDKDDETAGKG